MIDTYARSDTTIADRNAVLEPGAAKAIGFALLAALAVVGVVLRFFRFRVGEEDRPPIRVRNPDIDFSHEHGWVAEDPEWKPNHPNGKQTDYFLIRVMSPEGEPKEMKGWRIVFHYLLENGHEKKIKLMARPGGNPNKPTKEPRISPSGVLTRDQSGQNLRVRNGKRITRIEVEGEGDLEQERTFDGLEQVDICIYPKRDY